MYVLSGAAIPQGKIPAHGAAIDLLCEEWTLRWGRMHSFGSQSGTPRHSLRLQRLLRLLRFVCFVRFATVIESESLVLQAHNHRSAAVSAARCGEHESNETSKEGYAIDQGRPFSPAAEVVYAHFTTQLSPATPRGRV